MGVVGRYIDSLTDEQRDRIVEAQDWGYVTFSNPEETYNSTKGRLCLVDHVTGVGTYMKCEFENVDVFMPTVPRKYEALCARFGLNYMVRRFKKRASAIPLTQPVEEAKVEGKAIHHSTVGV